MLAAIYARKSTEQNGADADAKSVARQIEAARAFAAERGWTVADAHVFSDDAVSGAETRKLVDRQRLLDTIRSEPPFQALIMRDTSRFSRRDGDEAVGELKRIVRAGVDVWFYEQRTQFTFGTFAGERDRLPERGDGGRVSPPDLDLDPGGHGSRRRASAT